MVISPDLHWQEGLFLQPHHLQQFQHSFNNRLSGLRQLILPYPYGLIDSKFSYDSLANYLIKFDELHAVMPSGIEISIPGNAELPALDVKERFKSDNSPFTVLLGVPLWYASRANAIEPADKDKDWRIKRMYRVQESEYCDENTGKNPQPVMTRNINARLLIDHEDQSDLEVIPLLRVTHAAGEEIGKPRLDTNFIPPSLVLQGSSILREWIRDLTNQVEASRKEHLGYLTRAGFDSDHIRGRQIEQILRLQTLTRFATRLPQLLNAPNTTPFEIYLELTELLNELWIFTRSRNEFELTPYDHDEPAPLIRGITTRIRSLLQSGPKPSYEKISFELMDDVLQIDLSEEHLTKPIGYYLCIKTAEDPTSVVQLVEDHNRFKIMAKSLADRAIFGIDAKEERFPPSELPVSRDLSYFHLRLDGSAGSMWDSIKKEKNMAIRWPQMDQSDFQLTLYMIMPVEGEDS